MGEASMRTEVGRAFAHMYVTVWAIVLNEKRAI